MEKSDNYVYEMDWAKEENLFNSKSNYRKYQYDLIRNYVGNNILEVGTGDRAFTNLLIKNNTDIQRIYSIEPSQTLYEKSKNSYNFPPFVQFESMDIFDLKVENVGQFDTAIFIHVLEHIDKDKKALDVTHKLLKKDGQVLIEVPALPCLFSKHDESLGHYRRYNKKMLRSIIDHDKYEIIRMWYQDPIGVFGSYYFFKLRKIKLKSNDGQNLVSKQGGVYDKYIIPFEKGIEKIFTFPFGLSLTAILKKK